MGSDLPIWSRTKNLASQGKARVSLCLISRGFEPIKVERSIRKLLIVKRGGWLPPFEVNLISRDGRQGQDPALVGDLKLCGSTVGTQVKIEIWV